jgi:hypothetical protein
MRKQLCTSFGHVPAEQPNKQKRNCATSFRIYHIDMTECSAEQELVALFAAAVLEHFEAVDILCNLVALGSKHEFEDAKLRTEQTSSKCEAAKLALKRHRLEHNCRVEALPARASFAEPTHDRGKPSRAPS